jgi:acyl carrier protein
LTDTGVRRRIAELVHDAAEGRVQVADALAAGASLSALGLDSLGFLRLIDAVEEEYGVEVDLDSPGPRMDTVDEIVARMALAGAR